MGFFDSFGDNVRKKELKQQGLTLDAKLKHISGLPIPENQICNVYSLTEEYKFEANGLSINLQKNKITDLSVKTNQEITKGVSSIGGAVAGGVLLGPLGAIYGGRAKNVSTKTKYLVITYLKDEEVKYITFELDGFMASVQATNLEYEYKRKKLKEGENPFEPKKKIDL